MSPIMSCAEFSSFANPSASFPMTLWWLVLLGPSGWPLVVETRAPSEAEATRIVLAEKPYHQLATDPAGVPLVMRRPTAA